MYLLMAMFQIGGRVGKIDENLPCPLDFEVGHVKVWRKREDQQVGLQRRLSYRNRPSRRPGRPAACGEVVRQAGMPVTRDYGTRE